LSQDLHPFLLRQLKKLGISIEQPITDEQWQGFLMRISRAYHEADQDRYLMERSQDLASNEMAALYQALLAERNLLDQRIKERTLALAQSEARLRSLLTLSSDWFWEQDEELRFTHLSEGLKKTSGIDPADMLGKRRLDHQGFEVSPEALQRYHEQIENFLPFRDFVYKCINAQGDVHYFSISGEPIFGEGRRFMGYRGVGRDVTQTRLAEQQMLHLATYDSLTKLPNRNMFMAKLEEAVIEAGARHSSFAVLFLDLDRFKNVNDSLGHAAGDDLLIEMGRRLRELLREHDLVARLGGDEFVVLVKKHASVAALERVAEKMIAVITRPCMLQGREVVVTGSIGISAFPDDGRDAATLLRSADAAMYAAKERGRNTFEIFSSGIADRSSHQLGLEIGLRRALEQGEFTLHYQPKLDLHLDTIVGVEALLRWNHPQHGILAPGTFMSVAEDSGLITPIGRWVLEAACMQVAKWSAMGITAPRCAVNLSARQFADDSVISDVTAALKKSGIAPSLLEVEITETILMAEPTRAIEILHHLRSLGVHIALDDFGTGYSSLAYLKRFPASSVKIDSSFIEGLPDDRGDAAITRTVIGMAHSLDLRVVAEGIETPAQLEFLRHWGCDEAQGFLFYRPVPASELTIILGNSMANAEHRDAAQSALR
jgi:diguanylate cyclase (GGDEF)-like protein/PAS domain S-box-containing protein